MHEMAIVTSIIDSVCEHAVEIGANRVVKLTLYVGEVRDIHEPLLQRYFDHFSRCTIAEGVKVSMVTVPLRFCCDECGAVYGYDLVNERVLHPGSLVDAGGSEEYVAINPDRYSSDGGRTCGHAHAKGESPHCILHPEAEITVVSGTELYIEDIGVM